MLEMQQYGCEWAILFRVFMPVIRSGLLFMQMVPGAGSVPAIQRIPLPGAEMLEEEPLYVNAKQYHRILKRRQARAKLEAEGKIPKERRVCVPWGVLSRKQCSSASSVCVSLSQTLECRKVYYKTGDKMSWKQGTLSFLQ
jgi:hypothetical protein